MTWIVKANLHSWIVKKEIKEFTRFLAKMGYKVTYSPFFEPYEFTENIEKYEL